MGKKRRKTTSRDPVQRLQMWNTKVKGDIYTEYLKATKPLALPTVAKYQVTHEQLIESVKNALSNYPEEQAIMQEYMWFTSKLWKLTQTYKSEALQKEANALFLYYTCRGRDEIVLRKLASIFGIRIEDTHVLMENLTMKIIAEGTLTADGTEQTMLEYTPPEKIMAKISGYIDLQNMTSGDQIEIKAYVKIQPDGEYKLYHTETYIGEQEKPALHFVPILSGYAIKITLKQTTGTYKNYPYVFTRG